LKDIERYVGHGGSGDGPSYDLGGRGAKSISSPSKDISEEATIVVDIWVDKEGRVQRAEIGKGTTTTNSDMRASALQAARNSVFVKDDKAADLQKGTITYNFIIRQ
jgi:TonB family protein